MKVLLVEDDRLLGESLKEYLTSEGLKVDWVEDSREFFDLLEVSIYDVIVLDLMMPHVSGEELLKKLRERGDRTPVLILTAKSRIEDKERCFSLGADDYLTKPFEPKELLLRIRALHRRVVKEERVKLGIVEVDLQSCKLWVGGREVRISKKEWLLLKYLVENRGRFVSTAELLNYVWGDEPVGDEVVRAHIKNLRKVLPEGFILSHKGWGYKVES
ncbi:MAG: response regulator transcription factor [Aquificaceae bacterium]|nr:response regulator transcription factor [Aquificaceae bacterium]MCS7196007.1 response regulator transcription factor [Aquificaceae bacterium]MDW8032495.1 response regulator transcription factor [Aquificaceae bacterium]MDW8294859.1 response regulator transcription factor [Aquificaceae bacterium]